MKKYFILLLLLPYLNAQNIDVKVTPSQNNKGQIFWDINLNTNLPAGTILIVKMFFEGTTIPRSRRSVLIRGSEFIWRYGPISGKILSGDYICEIEYQHGYQRIKSKKLPVKSFTVSRTFYIGTPIKERDYRRKYALFFASILNKLKHFQEELQQVEKHLENKIEDSEIQNWAQKVRISHKKLRQNFLKYSSPTIFMTYSPESMADLKQALSANEWLMQVQLERVLVAYNLMESHYIPAEVEEYKKIGKRVVLTKEELKLLRQGPDDPKARVFRQKIDRLHKVRRIAVAFRKQQTNYELCIKKSIEQISKRERVPSFLNYRDLTKDIDWLKTTYQDIFGHYQKMQQGLKKNMWEQNMQRWQRDIKDLGEKITDYQKSPLVIKYPKILPRLKRIVSSLQLFLYSTTFDLYYRAGVTIPKSLPKVKKKPEQIRSLFHKDLTYLKKIIDKEQKLVEEMHSKHIAKIRGDLVAIEILYKELVKNFDSKSQKSFAKWERSWSKRFNKKQSQLLREIKDQQIIENFPHIDRMYQKILIHLNKIYFLYKNMRDDNFSQMAALEKNKLWFRKWMQRTYNMVK